MTKNKNYRGKYKLSIENDYQIKIIELNITKKNIW
jgi:hypothetical protein